MPENNSIPSIQEIGTRGEAIYNAKYQSEFEKTLHGKFVAIDVTSQEVTIADSADDALTAALRKSPQSFFHLIRVGFPAAFDVGWYISCAS